MLFDYVNPVNINTNHSTGIGSDRAQILSWNFQKNCTGRRTLTLNETKYNEKINISEYFQIDVHFEYG